MDAKASPSLDAVIKVAFCLEGRDKLTKVLDRSLRSHEWEARHGKPTD